MTIECIYVATHRFDMAFTRVCLASIRYWYPKVPIFLLKDRFNGDFSTRELETLYGAREFTTKRTKFGWGMSKLEPFFQPGRQRFLVLDSDIVFVGRVLDKLAQCDGDMIVHGENQPFEKLEQLYFSLNRLKTLDPQFKYDSMTFNTGQFVGTTGLFKRSDFEPFVTSSEPPALRNPEVFKNGDQGLLNFIALSKQQRGRITLKSVPFMWWSPDEMAQVDVGRMRSDSPYPYLIHWAGQKHRRFRSMPRGDVLQFFESLHYQGVAAGPLRCRCRQYRDDVARKWLNIKRFKIRAA